MSFVVAVLAVLAFVVFAAPGVALADGREALVVGNSTYAHIGRLPNPDNDAQDMSAALRRLGFEVTTELDADRVELTAALRAFTRRSAGADVSVVFYVCEDLKDSGLPPTTRCCGADGIVRPSSVCVCSPASRRVAPLRPRYRGACGLDTGSAHARPDWLLSDDAES